MRLQVESDFKPVGGVVGAGFDKFRWPRPVRPGDELHIESEVPEIRPSKSRPTQGVIKVRTTTLNQNGETVQVQVGNLIVPLRPKPWQFSQAGDWVNRNGPDGVDASRRHRCAKVEVLNTT